MFPSLLYIKGAKSITGLGATITALACEPTDLGIFCKCLVYSNNNGYCFSYFLKSGTISIAFSTVIGSFGCPSGIILEIISLTVYGMSYTPCSFNAFPRSLMQTLGLIE